MTQIKIFMNTQEAANVQEIIEKQVNEFLKENDGKIAVRDIKYSSTDKGNCLWRNWTVIVVCDVKGSSAFFS